jgi:hypothetical protein
VSTTRRTSCACRACSEPFATDTIAPLDAIAQLSVASEWTTMPLAVPTGNRRISNRKSANGYKFCDCSILVASGRPGQDLTFYEIV